MSRRRDEGNNDDGRLRAWVVFTVSAQYWSAIQAAIECDDVTHE